MPEVPAQGPPSAQTGQGFRAGAPVRPVLRAWQLAALICPPLGLPPVFVPRADFPSSEHPVFRKEGWVGKALRGRKSHQMSGSSSHITDAGPESPSGVGGDGDLPSVPGELVQSAWAHGPASLTARRHVFSPCSPGTCLRSHRALHTVLNSDGHAPRGGGGLLGPGAPLPLRSVPWAPGP